MRTARIVVPGLIMGLLMSLVGFIGTAHAYERDVYWQGLKIKGSVWTNCPKGSGTVFTARIVVPKDYTIDSYGEFQLGRANWTVKPADAYYRVSPRKVEAYVTGGRKMKPADPSFMLTKWFAVDTEYADTVTLRLGRQCVNNEGS